MKHLAFALLATLLLATFVFANTPQQAPFVNHPVVSGIEEIDAPVVYPPYLEPIMLDNEDVIGDTFKIGTTWYESQANGTIPQEVVKDSLGYVHFAWMNALNSGAANRHIYYNYISPAGTQGWPGVGTQVDAVYRSGFTGVDVQHGNRAFPYFHQVQTQGSPITWTAVAADVQPHFGAFLTTEAPAVTGINAIIWPNARWGKIAGGARFHNVSQENVGIAGAPQRQFYDYGTYNATAFTVNWNPTWTQFEYSQTIAYTVATSRTTNKVAIAWTHCREDGYPGQPGQTFTQFNNDIYLVVDDDGQNISFANPTNVTNFIPPDPSLLPDTLAADKDTLRAYTDCDVFIDHNDYVHVAFSTAAYFTYEGTTYWNASIVWHWSSQYVDTFKMIANGFNPNDIVECGAWQLKVQRPMMGEGPAPNYYLYSMYHKYDTDSTHLSAAGFPSGEVWISASATNGLSWSQGTNVTSTLTPLNAPPGSCLSELTPTMDEKVDTYCHLTYIMDKDAGNILQSEGSWTLNDVKYHRVPTASIPITPLLPQIYNLHIGGGGPVAPVQVVLTPFGTPIVVPPGGGSFNFNVAVNNTSTSPQTTDGWAFIKLPSGSLYGPVLGPVLNLTLPAGGSINRNRTQSIPGSAPAGSYQYIAYVGDYTSPTVYTVSDSDFFPFSKSAVDLNGPVTSWEAWGEEFETALTATPSDYSLTINASPNPFNPTTTLRYTVATAGYVTLKVYDLRGSLVATLVDGQNEVGNHNVIFDGSNLASGIYLYNLNTNGNVASGKMMLVK